LPGVLVHGVALKPGKPLCLAAVGGKPIAVLPGFPTSAIFTFHTFVAPVIRRRAGLPAEAAQSVAATIPVRITSEIGREEFVLVALVPGDKGLVAFPTGKSSGAVTSFSQADGFVAIDALSGGLDAGSNQRVTLIGAEARTPDIVIMGSHCVALDILIDRLTDQGFLARTVAVGSVGGVAAIERGECDIAPVHLFDSATSVYNRHLVRPGITLKSGWQRIQGFVFRPGDSRFAGKCPGGATRGTCRPVLPHDQPQRQRRNPHTDRSIARRSAAAGLRQSAKIPQRGRCRGGPRAGGLGDRHRHCGEALRVGLSPNLARVLRFSRCRKPLFPPSRPSVSRSNHGT
jgi:hypothetical protein